MEISQSLLMLQRRWFVGVLAVLVGLAGRPVAGAEGVLDPESTYKQARAALHASNFGIAGRLFENLVRQFPDNADFLLGLGQARLAAGENESAIAVLEEARRLAPRYLDVLQVLTSAYLANGDDTAARATRVAAAKIAPDAAWLQARVPAAVVVPQDGGLTVAMATAATRTERNDTWHESVINMEYRWSRTSIVGFRAARSQRFGRRDSLYEIYGSLPLSPRIIVTGRGLHSPSHRVRHKNGALADVSMLLAKGWVVTVGGGRTRYNSGPSDKGALTIERYFSDYRLAYTAMAVKPDGGPWSPVQRLSGSWYYGGDNRLNFNFAAGEETDESVIGTSSLAFDTWGVGLGGRHWFTARFAVDYSVGYEGLESSRGDHLDRTTFYAGIAFRL